jgi:predicted dehydrogenase
MKEMKTIMILGLGLLFTHPAGGQVTTTKATAPMFTPVTNSVKLITLDPGHFHAALVQKTMYEKVDPVVHVYAPQGAEVESYLQRIADYNSRTEEPTSWRERIYTGTDFLEKMLSRRKGNVVVISGNNARKTEYILKSVQRGLHVLADKPMVISPDNFPLLEEAFAVAEKKGVLLYDIMTERHEITTLLQKEISQIPAVFGELQRGTPDNPAITKVSVHHFSKIVSGKPLIRPPWFFDVTQQGEGIVDVTTHLVDLVQWEAFPEVVLKKSDVEIISARRWSTDLYPAMFEKVTGLSDYPDYLSGALDGKLLKVYSNGEINYTLKGVHARVSVTWNFQSPEGSGDTHFSVMRGTRCNLTIRQGKPEGYTPKLYIEATHVESQEAFTLSLIKAMAQLTLQYPGLVLNEVDEITWMVEIPDRYRVGHEAHFSQVTEKFLGYLSSGTLPAWEIPNMIVKYHTTTEGIKKAMEQPK